MNLSRKLLHSARSAGRKSTDLTRERRMPRPERTALSMLLSGLGLALLALAIGGPPADLHPRLLTSFAIISLAVGFRIAGGPPSTSKRDPR